MNFSFLYLFVVLPVKSKLFSRWRFLVLCRSSRRFLSLQLWSHRPCLNTLYSSTSFFTPSFSINNLGKYIEIFYFCGLVMRNSLELWADSGKPQSFCNCKRCLLWLSMLYLPAASIEQYLVTLFGGNLQQV